MPTDDPRSRLPVITEDTLLSAHGNMREALRKETGSTYLTDILSRIETENPLLYGIITRRVKSSCRKAENLSADEGFADLMGREILLTVAAVYSLLESQLEADYLNTIFKLNEE
jgi:hypothetical protein